MAELSVDELAQMGTWLAEQDHDRASMQLQDAYTAISTAGWELSRPMREALQRHRQSAA